MREAITRTELTAAEAQLTVAKRSMEEARDGIGELTKRLQEADIRADRAVCDAYAAKVRAEDADQRTAEAADRAREAVARAERAEVVAADAGRRAAEVDKRAREAEARAEKAKAAIADADR